MLGPEGPEKGRELQTETETSWVQSQHSEILTDTKTWSRNSLPSPEHPQFPTQHTNPVCQDTLTKEICTKQNSWTSASFLSRRKEWESQAELKGRVRKRNVIVNARSLCGSPQSCDGQKDAAGSCTAQKAFKSSNPYLANLSLSFGIGSSSHLGEGGEVKVFALPSFPKKLRKQSLTPTENAWGWKGHPGITGQFPEAGEGREFQITGSVQS